jgi:hypothetical protein
LVVFIERWLKFRLFWFFSVGFACRQKPNVPECAAGFPAWHTTGRVCLVADCEQVTVKPLRILIGLKTLIFRAFLAITYTKC